MGDEWFGLEEAICFDAPSSNRGSRTWALRGSNRPDNAPRAIPGNHVPSTTLHV